MGRFVFPIAMVLAATPAVAQQAPVPLATAEEIQGQIPGSGTLESRVDGDLNGDGEIDTAFVWRGEEAIDEERGLKVLMAYRTEVDMGHDPVGEAMLDPFPQGPGSLSIREGVLIFEDLTGGTTATQSTRRYRYDAKQGKMRLIGIDVQRYSRTNSHGTIDLSWNLLNGKQIVQRGEPNTSGRGDEALIYAKPEHGVHTSSPIWMENSPDPDTLIDEQIAAEGEDRD
ncbi:hypothetical protein M2650_01355 [Luteimonas sp. SX5]|uniref:Uncharacterized protein n=1 Tax=Luteimonas galliterrae TaxID=2940486 RepID=A0ABT0MEK3_9GAMM|nr:hypothetical protein [Luteimonas galliterrae]MCL1633294.1 hypothetical protein [Luteimonas galliterrae]